MFKKNEFFEGIKKNSKICIWGCANAGITTKEVLSNIRPDVEVVAYIDSTKTGDIDGIKIYRQIIHQCIIIFFIFCIFFIYNFYFFIIVLRHKKNNTSFLSD